eukprot:922783-Amphidinium_carterae.1
MYDSDVSLDGKIATITGVIRTWVEAQDENWIKVVSPLRNALYLAPEQYHGVSCDYTLFTNCHFYTWAALYRCSPSSIIVIVLALLAVTLQAMPVFLLASTGTFLGLNQLIRAPRMNLWQYLPVFGGTMAGGMEDPEDEDVQAALAQHDAEVAAAVAAGLDLDPGITDED